MRAYLKRKHAELQLAAAGFIFKKHQNPYLQRLANFLAWANYRRKGKQPLHFLHEADSKDEQF